MAHKSICIDFYSYYILSQEKKINFQTSKKTRRKRNNKKRRKEKETRGEVNRRRNKTIRELDKK